MKAEYITPAVTLFNEAGKPDYENLGKLYEHLIAGGISVAVNISLTVESEHTGS